MDNCIFCKITKKEAPADILLETDTVMVFKDIYPSAPVHYLAVLKKHIPSIKEMSPADGALLNSLMQSAKDAAEKLGLSGYKLVFNVGKDGGQIVDHLHLHILGGWGKNSPSGIPQV